MGLTDWLELELGRPPGSLENDLRKLETAASEVAPWLTLVLPGVVKALPKVLLVAKAAPLVADTVRRARERIDELSGQPFIAWVCEEPGCRVVWLDGTSPCGHDTKVREVLCRVTADDPDRYR